MLNELITLARQIIIVKGVVEGVGLETSCKKTELLVSVSDPHLFQCEFGSETLLSVPSSSTTVQMESSGLLAGSKS